MLHFGLPQNIALKRINGNSALFYHRRIAINSGNRLLSDIETQKQNGIKHWTTFLRTDTVKISCRSPCAR